MQSQWLRTTISGVNEKITNIANLMEIDGDSKKEEMMNIVKNLCISYSTLAHDYDHLMTNSNEKQKHVSQSWDNNNNDHDADYSHPESTVEDVDESSTDDTESIITSSEEPTGEGLSSMFECLKLVQETTSAQLELIKQNSEKRGMILELRDEVRRLEDENQSLKRQVGYYERNIGRVCSSLGRKTAIRDKLFICTTTS